MSSLEDRARNQCIAVIAKGERLTKREAIARIAEYCDEVERGERIIEPMHSNPTKPAISKIARYIGVSTWTLNQSEAGQRFRDMLSSVGVAGLRGRQTPTLRELFQPLLTHREQELKLAKATQESIDAQLSNLRWAINKVIKSEVLGIDADAREALEKGLARAQEDKSRSLAAELRRSIGYLEEVAASSGLPLEFHAAVGVAAARIGVTKAAIMREFGFERTYFLDAMIPPPRGSTIVREIEEMLGLLEGTLSSRVRYTSVRKRKVDPKNYPEILQINEDLRFVVRQFLAPEDFHLPREEFVARCMIVVDYLLEARPEADETGKFKRESYALRKWPEGVKAEFDRILAVKTQIISGDYLLPGDYRWGKAIAIRVRSELSYFFGYLRGPLDEEPRIDLNGLTLALLTRPDLILNFFKWRLERQGAARAAEGFSNFDMGMLSVFRTLVAPDAGLIWQQPELADKLVPLKGFITEAEIARIRSDWNAACKLAFDRYNLILKSYGRKAREREGGQETVASILAMPRPLMAFATLIKAVRSSVDQLEEGSMEVAINLSHQVYVGIQAQCALRCETLSALLVEYLVEENGVFTLKIPYKLFKNEDSPYFKVGPNLWRDFERVLADTGGLYHALRKYLSWARPRLLGTKKDKGTLLINAWGYPINSDNINRFAKILTARHLAWNPLTKTGIEGLRPFPNHCFRHILATGTLKLTDSRRLAADAICDTVETVDKHYLRWLPRERQDDLQMAIARGLEDADR